MRVELQAEPLEEGRTFLSVKGHEVRLHVVCGRCRTTDSLTPAVLYAWTRCARCGRKRALRWTTRGIA
jgi:hypothetical protein